MLYNLTYDGDNYVSSKPPTSLPEQDYSFIEINYSDKHIKSVKGSMNLEIEKECILSDLDISEYMNKLDLLLKREDIDKDKIQLNFVENLEDEDIRIKKIFLILLSSYLIYFNFLEFPFSISLELLDNRMFKYFTDFAPTNALEKSFVKQVSLLHRYFSTIFEDKKENTDNFQDINKLIKEKIDDEVKELSKDIKEFKKRLLADLKNKNETLRKEIKEDILNRFSKILSSE